MIYLNRDQPKTILKISKKKHGTFSTVNQSTKTNPRLLSRRMAVKGSRNGRRKSSKCLKVFIADWAQIGLK